MSITAGTHIDRYQIISPLGSGGMGVIYLAQDTRLGRKVALKLLPAQYTQDADRLRRFKTEAYVASSLNHPNIITIFEIGNVDGRHFIATEFIEGGNLRRRLIGSKLSLTRILEISNQVMSALAAAHAAGIVHRDIKPENIMIRPDGYVKVVDFGLVKLTENASLPKPVNEQLDPLSSESPAPANFSTTETAPQNLSDLVDDLYPIERAPDSYETTHGTVMGTVQYMSPEQARGLRVDSRSDIFSFGIVLYEMIAGRAPFSGKSASEIIDAILNKEPPALSHYYPEVPEVLEWITAKALIKDRDERYQTAKEMLNDLKRLQHRLGIEYELSRSLPLGRSGEIDSSRRSVNGVLETDRPVDTQAQSAFLFLDRHSSIIRRSRLTVPILFVSLLFLLIAAVFGIYQFIQSQSRHLIPFQPMQVRRFTLSGKANRAAISPDGKYVVHVLSEGGRQSLLVRQATASNNVPIVPPAEVTYRGMTFSHDGTLVYYVLQEQNNPINDLYQVPVLGGVPQKIIRNIDSPIAISPDSTQIAFVRRDRGKGEDALIIAGIDGIKERAIATRKGPDFFVASGPAWSPDGNLIVCPAGTNKGGRQVYLVEIDVKNAYEKTVSDRKWANMGRVAWLSNGRGIIATATEQGSTLAQVWHIPYPRGNPNRITNDLNNYVDLSMTADSTALVTVQSEAYVNVWISQENGSVLPRQITDGTGLNNGRRGLTWLPDGRLVYVSSASGSQDIWTMDQYGRSNIQWTSAETRADIYPSASPDGRYIVFVSTRSGNSNLYRLDLKTRDQLQLTYGTGEEFPEVSADSKWVIYTATGSTDFTLWKVPIEGGHSVKLTDRLSQWPDASPDGQRIAYWYRPEPNARWQIAIIPIVGGNPERVFDVPPIAETPIPIRWMPDGKGISFVATQDGISNIWQQPIEGSPPRQLTNFSSDQIFWFDWSHDGRQLATSRGRVTGDVVLFSKTK
jgi:eukaryotic-like serine/threonine-protein kinase